MKKQNGKNNSSPYQVQSLFTLLTVLIVMIGQIILYTTPVNSEVVLPASIWLCVIGVFLFIVSSIIRPPRWLQDRFARLSVPHELPWILMAAVFTLLATLSAYLFEKAGRVNYLSVLALWLSAGICYATAFLKDALPKFDWKEWLKTYKNELIVVGVVTLVGAIVRFVDLGGIPRIINGDEGRMALAAKSTVRGPLSNPFALWENFGAVYLQWLNFLFKLFGENITILRLPTTFGGIFAIPTVYLLARYLAGKRVALITSILAVFSHTLINFSRSAAVGYIQDTFLIPLELYLLFSGLDKRSSWRTAVAGVLIAVHFSIYLTAQLVTGLVIAFLLIAFLFFRKWIMPAWRQVLIFWGGFAIQIIPEAFYIVRHKAEFLARISLDGTFQSGWLAQTMAATGQSAVQILAGRVVHAFLALIYYPSVDFYGSPAPMLTLIAATLFLIGAGISIWQTGYPRYLLLNGYLWGFTLAVGIFAIPPSADTYRMLPVLPAALILAAIALDHILELIGWGWQKSRLGYSVLTSIILISLMLTNLWTYYGEFAGQCLYGDNLAGRFASYLGSYAASVPPEETIYLLSDDIYFYGSHASADFLDHGRTILNYRDPVDSLQPLTGDVIIANPDRFEELKVWVTTHPGGKLQFRYDCSNLILIAYQYP